ncbi:phosphoesterase [Agrobacterium vitis]|uniref:alkaline phosphatase family protein n=1 Tax=Allorhizobium ampelinum TaxID=3025782 RepID=UPI001F31E7FB|nr:alkaline phosphatase family protein [Allorhizobium ampelinum]MCF1470769.1 phosphoesterase [Allorhizobium ampelinum]
MSTQQYANISITNNTGQDADIVLFHQNSSNGIQRGSWAVGIGETAGPLKVLFETGLGTQGILDYWSVMLFVRTGPQAGLYVSSGSPTDPYWKECQLQHADASQSITLSVDTSTFNVALKSGGCTNGMTRLTPAAAKPISHVFVVMLENHSFDNMLAMSGIPGITAATAANYNEYNGTAYHVQSGAPLSMPTDPGHEFDDVVTQLAGPGATFQGGQPYPAIDNSGFAASYATSTTEDPHLPPAANQIQYIMNAFDTPTQLPVLGWLASQFGVCDHWYSSLPGPTWPNRFFLHGASSSGFDDSPGSAQMAGWELPGLGFKYPNGSIYQRLVSQGIPYRFYRDANSSHLSLYSDDPAAGSILGSVPQVSSLSGVTLGDFQSLQNFAADLQGPYPYPYTFIEPHYGDITGGTYQGGSSQHPMDDPYGGEHLLAAVYSAIRNSPYWDTSLLVIIYDEHGGYYDSVSPANGSATAPGDNPNYGYNTHGFDFTTLGVRVPAVLVSPLIPQGTVDHNTYDHSSVPKLLEELWGLAPLTNRDAAANSPLGNISLTSARTLQAPPAPIPSASSIAQVRTVAERAITLEQNLPERGNLAGTVATLRKADAELSDQSPTAIAAIQAKAAAIRTRGDAEAYAAEVLAKLDAAQAQRRIIRRGRH